MNEKSVITLGDAIFGDIDNNDYLNRLYEDMLYNYAIKKLSLKNHKPRKVDINAALRFADLLSKSTHETKSDDHKMWVQAIITLLLESEPPSDDISYYAGAILTNIGNFRGVEISKTVYNSKYDETNLREKAFIAFMNKYLSVPSEDDKKFFIPQKNIYDRLEGNSLSYSAPTSMGKSFVMEVFIKEKITNGAKLNFARIVPTKAWINEVREDTVNGLSHLLKEKNYSVVTSANDYALDENHNFILIMTPERLLYLLIHKPQIDIDYIFIDEAHKLTGRNKRGAFYYITVEMLTDREHRPYFIFASPNIPNPDVYLKLVMQEEKCKENYESSTFSPVTQFKFLVNEKTCSVNIFNEHTQNTVYICKYHKKTTPIVDFMNYFWQLENDKPLSERKRNIAYFSGKDAAIKAAIEYSHGKNDIDDKDLQQLSYDIASQIHQYYFLADLVKKGIAYHIGYLPNTIRQRIERLFKDGKITAMFCTSTLIEGVNLPADNLFITNYKSGRPKMTSVEFRNLIGRVGRIKFNLYGNVFFISDDDKVKEDEYVKLLKNPIPKQKLSVTDELNPKLKRHIVETLLKGEAKIEEYKTPSGKSQPEEEYIMMRKFGLILLKDIMSKKDTFVKREFSEFMSATKEKEIYKKFQSQREFIDSDINISADQSKKLFAAIRQGLKYPKHNKGSFDYDTVRNFLEKLCDIFNWDKYEPSTLGYKNRYGNHSKLSWYAVILCRWMEGRGLQYIMTTALKYMKNNPDKFWLNKYTKAHFDDSQEHRNIVFSDTLEAIENVILFSLSNYFLRFSNMYAKINGEKALNDNNWYEFVEYGTINPITVFLQRSGFSRESANFIKEHSEYIVQRDDTMRLKRSLLNAKNHDAREEAQLILLNRPQIFEVEEK